MIRPMIAVAAGCAALCALLFLPAIAQSDGLATCEARSGNLRVPGPGQSCRRGETPHTLATSGGGAGGPHLRWVDSTGNVVAEFVTPPVIVASDRPLLAAIQSSYVVGAAEPYFTTEDCTGTAYVEPSGAGLDSAHVPVGSSTIYARDLSASAGFLEAHSHWTLPGCVTLDAGGVEVLGTAMAAVGELPAFSFPLHVEVVGDVPNF